ncbi:type I restriction enzyme HsdR N-terminal domain-containing protein [Arachidicoccus ginsenosidimutans]|uniref:type I restriction enzyme HsdR N-terminal domain-containing protein n=1 Tax=Arachidicoccus sp. BS20 TaxID=1850526 RepID=UPI0009EE12A5|nr:type I restriction enzyme HsdR N-terminal domain-containing protein [Arachidicoccus sp. BS20]
MLSINFPKPDFKIKGNQGEEQIFDGIRKRWLRLTPEEWVRQNFIQYLIKEKKYPASLISVEKEIVLGEMKKRYDIVVYKDTQPWVIVECKEMNVQLNEKVLNQLLRYNATIVAPYLIITNGKQSFGWKIENGNFIEMDELPEW